MEIIQTLNGIQNGNVISLIDIILFPFYSFLFYKLVKYTADKYKDPLLKKYLLLGFKVKLAFTLLFVLVFVFYYKSGDTFAYLYNVLQLKELMTTNPIGTYLIMFDPGSFDAYYIMKDYMLSGGSYMTDDSSRIIVNMSFFLGYLCFNSYIVICLFFSMMSFLGCWKLFRVFYELYPHLHREIALACLFIPSVCFWSGGLLKDPVCIGALGIFTYSIYDLLIKKKSVISNILIIISMVIIIMDIKIYIILSYLPAVAMWIFSRYRYAIKSKFIKSIIGPLLLVGGVALGAIILTQMAAVAEKYSFEAMMRTAQDTQNWLVTSSQMSGGSYYTLGDINYSMMGLLKIFPNAVNVALFRPYIWEAKKPILMIASVEGIFTFFLTVRLLFKSGFINFFKMIAANPEVQFCLIFSIIFAFAVGFTSYNFGALARYKIPFMPFYYIALFILSDAQKKAATQQVKK